MQEQDGKQAGAPGGIFPPFPKTIEVKVEVPGLSKLLTDSAYEAGAKTGGGIGLVAGILVAFLAVVLFGRGK